MRVIVRVLAFVKEDCGNLVEWAAGMFTGLAQEMQKRQASGVRRRAFGFRLSAFGFRLSAFGFRLSAWRVYEQKGCFDHSHSSV
jgi:hypothetical protein